MKWWDWILHGIFTSAHLLTGIKTTFLLKNIWVMFPFGEMKSVVNICLVSKLKKYNSSPFQVATGQTSDSEIWLQGMLTGLWRLACLCSWVFCWVCVIFVHSWQRCVKCIWSVGLLSALFSQRRLLLVVLTSGFEWSMFVFSQTCWVKLLVMLRWWCAHTHTQPLVFFYSG